MSDQFAQLKAACALIMVGDVFEGNGYLVAPQWAVTCASISRKKNSPIHLHFDGHKRTAQVFREDSEADCSLLRLDKPINKIQPLSLAKNAPVADRWYGVGGSDIAESSRILLSGTIVELHALDQEGGPAVLLSCEQLMGSLSRFGILSGIPIMAQDHIVGHLKGVRANGANRPGDGLIFACPVRYILELMSHTLGTPVARQTSQSYSALAQAPGYGYDKKWYVHRWKEEREALNILSSPGSPVVLVGPDGFGKSTLLNYLVESICEKETKKNRAVHINLSNFSPHSLQSLDGFLHELAHELVEQAEGPDDWVDEAWRRPAAGPRKLTRLMEQRILPWAEGRLVLAIDSADAIGSEAIRSEFFGMLRAWATMNHRSSWAALRLLMTVSTSPARLIQSVHQSPFNLTPSIFLSDLESDQVAELAHRYGLYLKNSEIELLLKLVGGHPYLLRLIMHNAAIHNRSVEWLVATEGRGLFSEFLEHRRRWLEAHPSLLQAFKTVLEKPNVELAKADIQRLVDAGLIVTTQYGYRVRYLLYRDILK